MENGFSVHMTIAKTIEVTRTYLEMRDPAQLQPAHSEDPRVRIERQPDCSTSFFRFLYAEVGRQYNWIDRLPWTDEQIRAYLQSPEISLWLMSYEDAPA